MSETKPAGGGAISEIPEDSDTDIEAAVSKVLAPVVARATNGGGNPLDERKATEDEPVVAATEPTKHDSEPEEPSELATKPASLTESEPEPPAEPEPLAAAEPEPDRPAVAEPEPEPLAAAEPEPDRPAVAEPEPEPPATAEPEPLAEPEAPVPPPLAPTIPVPPVAEAPEPAPSPVARSLTTMNRVYDHLVEGEDDVIGLITYSLYKRDKRDWLVSWTAKHDTEPTADQVEAFVNAQMSTAQRDRYRNAARQVLDAYASVAVDIEKPLIITKAIGGRVEDAAKRVETAGRWYRQVPAVFAGAILGAAIIIGVIAILIAAGVDLAGYLGFEAGAVDGVP